MPAIRLNKAALSYNPAPKKPQVIETDCCVLKPQNSEANSLAVTVKTTVKTNSELEKVVEDIFYPTDAADRKTFRTKAGKTVTSHQWDVYDFTFTIPCGRVTTYKDVSLAVGGSPRSVGNALRNNPFAPYIPCHRVIASNFFVGGFMGEWGANDKTGTRYNQKLDLLLKEGVSFTQKGHLSDTKAGVWRGPIRLE